MIRVSASLASVIETDVLDHAPDDPPDGYDAIRAAWRAGALEVDPGAAEALAAALCDLSNACDEATHGRGRACPDLEASERAIYSHAARSASALLGKVLRKAEGK